MEVSFARYVKGLGRLSSEELATMFSKSQRVDDDKVEFVRMLKEFVVASDEQNVEVYERKSKTKSKTRSNKRNIIREAIIKMREKLYEYEQSDQIDQWNIYFTVGKNYNFDNLDDVKESHTQ